MVTLVTLVNKKIIGRKAAPSPHPWLAWDLNRAASMRAVRRRTQPLPDGLHAALQALVLLHTLTAVVLGADMCTKAVVVRSEPSKKVHVLRRVPASCSNWEKAWSWITKKDCGTKYKWPGS